MCRIKHSLRFFVLLLTMYAVQSLHLKDCNFTNFEFMSKYNLGQQDELNRTFSKINQNMSKLGNITRVINT